MKRTALLLIMAMLISLLTPITGLADDRTPNLSLFSDKPLSFNDWYAADKQHINGLLASYSTNLPQLQQELSQEWESIVQVLSDIQNSPTIDMDYKYRYFSPDQTGKMHVLLLAKAFREKAIESCLQGKAPNISDYPDLLTGAKSVDDGLPFPKLSAANRDAYVTEAQIRYALTGLVEARDSMDTYEKIPKTLLAGVTIYSMPYVMEGTSGVAFSHYLPGSDQAIYLSAIADRAVGGDVFRNVDETITHNIAHYLHQHYMGRCPDGSSKWADFLRLFDKTYDPSAVWKDRPEENFAEYFRMVYGAPESKRTPFQGGYEAPKTASRLNDGVMGIVMSFQYNERSMMWDWLKSSIKQKTSSTYINYNVGPARPGFTTVVLTGSELTFTGTTVIQTSNPLGLVPAYRIYRIDSQPGSYAKMDSTSTSSDVASMSGAKTYALTANLNNMGHYYLDLGSYNPSTYKYTTDWTIRIISCPKTSMGSNSITFTDTTSHWALPYIKALVAKKIISGFTDGTFRPENPVTRAQFTKMLVDIKGFKKTGVTGYWPDLLSTHWATPYIGAAIQNGVVKLNEFPDNKFYPDRPITRQEAALMVAKAFGANALSSDDFWLLTRRTEVKDNIDATYSGYVAYCVSNKYMSGYPDGNFYPNRTLNRAEAAVLMNKLME